MEVCAPVLLHHFCCSPCPIRDWADKINSLLLHNSSTKGLQYLQIVLNQATVNSHSTLNTQIQLEKSRENRLCFKRCNVICLYSAGLHDLYTLCLNINILFSGSLGENISALCVWNHSAVSRRCMYEVHWQKQPCMHTLVKQKTAMYRGAFLLSSRPLRTGF